MATTTPNYGWSVPTSTDLVKDGATAIETLGDSVDATTKALNPSTTLGDIEYRSATANTNTRLALGTAGQVLTVNSGATAPQWSAPVSGGMTLINTGGTTLTGASVTISSIPATYNDLVIYIVAARGATDGAALRVRFNGTATGYLNAEGAQMDGGASTFADSQAILAYSPDNGASTSLQHIIIPNYANSTTWKFAEINSIALDNATPTSAQVLWSYGVLNSTTAISSLEFAFTSGNATSGTIYVYGVK